MLQNIQLHILKGRYLDSARDMDVYHKTYLHWKKIWVEILDSKDETTSDNFLRQDCLCSLLFNNEVIGLITCSFFNPHLEAMRDHSYLRPFSLDVYSSKDKQDICMSIEYLSVSPEFRKSNLPVSLGSVLLGISMNVFKSSGAYSVLGTARKKLQVDSMCYNFGFQPVGRVEKFGLDCALIVNKRSQLKEHPDILTRSFVDTLWENRVESLEIFRANNNRRIVA